MGCHCLWPVTEALTTGSGCLSLTEMQGHDRGWSWTWREASTPSVRSGTVMTVGLVPLEHPIDMRACLTCSPWPQLALGGLTAARPWSPLSFKDEDTEIPRRRRVRGELALRPGQAPGPGCCPRATRPRA